MKRIGNIFLKVCEMDNLVLADQIAQKGKGRQNAVWIHNKNKEANLLQLREMLLNKTFRTSPYETFPVYEPKERLVFRLPYFPDRILHHAIMNILEPIFVCTFTADSYSSIKGRGIHSAAGKIKKALKRDVSGTQYCLKMDIRKFYPSIDHSILKQLLRRKFKDADLLELLDEIINSAEGLPIGNYLSQYFANFYLTGLDHCIKEVLKVKYYFRYADDIVILAASKAALHRLRSEIAHYLESRLKLDVKNNYQVFPVQKRGIDFLGYVFFHTHTLLRKSIKQNFARAAARKASRETLASYKGWAQHANTKHLMKKLLPSCENSVILASRPTVRALSETR